MVVQLRFEPGDDDAFLPTRDALLDEFREWVREPGRLSAEDAVEYAAHCTLVFHWLYQRGGVIDLSRFTIEDLDEFFFGWLPAKYLGDPVDAPAICNAVASFIQFLSETRRLAASVGAVAKLMTHCDRSHDAVAAAMSDPSKFGLGKSVFSAPTGHAGIDLRSILDDPDLDTDQLQAALDEQMDAFNALTFDERKAATDGYIERKPEPIDIPVVHTVPTATELAESALTSELWRCVHGFVRELGTGGVAVTSAGYIKPAEARRIARAIGTPDVLRFVDSEQGDAFLARITSAADLPWLEYIEALAEEVGALHRLKTKLKARQGWLDAVDADAAAVAIDVGRIAASAGALSPIFGNGAPLYAEIAELLDGGIPHWLTFAIGVGSEVEIEQFIVPALDNAGQIGRGIDARTGDLEEWYADIVIEEYFAAIENLRVAGFVSIRDRREYEDHNLRRFEGGWFSLTPLGREVFAPIIRAVGYEFAELADLGGALAVTAVNALATGSVDPEVVVERWQPDLAPADRVGLLADLLMSDTIAAQRTFAFGLIRAIDSTDDPATVASISAHIRALLDTPSAGHAATYLLDRGLATSDEVGAFLSIDTFVDLLATTLGDEETLAALFMNTQQQSDIDLIDDMWRCDVEETSDVLEAIGRHVPDQAIAKAARRAVFRRNSWLANL